jgi:hypothetical protein
VKIKTGAKHRLSKSNPSIPFRNFRRAYTQISDKILKMATISFYTKWNMSCSIYMLHLQITSALKMEVVRPSKYARRYKGEK